MTEAWRIAVGTAVGLGLCLWFGLWYTLGPPDTAPSDLRVPAATSTPGTAEPRFQAAIGSVRLVEELPDRLVVDVEYSYAGPLAWLLVQRIIGETSRSEAYGEELASADPDVPRTVRLELTCDPVLPAGPIRFRVSIRIADGPWITWPEELPKLCP